MSIADEYITKLKQREARRQQLMATLREALAAPSTEMQTAHEHVLLLSAVLFLLEEAP